MKPDGIKRHVIINSLDKELEASFIANDGYNDEFIKNGYHPEQKWICITIPQLPDGYLRIFEV